MRIDITTIRAAAEAIGLDKTEIADLLDEIGERWEPEGRRRMVTEEVWDRFYTAVQREPSHHQAHLTSGLAKTTFYRCLRKLRAMEATESCAMYRLA